MRLEDVQIGQRVRYWGTHIGTVVEVCRSAKQWPVSVVAEPPGDGHHALNASELELLEPVAPVIDWQARAERAEADADRLAAGLHDYCACPTYGIENRKQRPCDYHALHDEAVAQR